MLGPGRYLLGAAELLLLAGFAWLGAAALRAWLLPRFQGAPAHLATAVLASALLLWPAQLLGSVGLLKPAPYLALVIVASVALRYWLGRGTGAPPAGGAAWGDHPRGGEAPAGGGGTHAVTGPAGCPPHPSPATAIALIIAAIALLRFALETKTKLGTGMTGFDTTWYHGPFAAGFFQSGDTWDLHFIAPQFLAWFYPANAELFHATGMLAFGRDLLSPLLNLGWFAGCLLACWCIGRPYRVAPWSLALGAVALSLPGFADQAGEMRNDIVGAFFLLAAVAVALNAWPGRRDEQRAGEREGFGGGPSLGALAVIGLAAGLAAGTKLNFLLPTAVLVVGLAVLAPKGRRWPALWAPTLAALAGGGYWYLRNLAHSGNPLPWVDGLGPVSLPAPDQALGGREAHSVLGYLTDGAVWSDWLVPGLEDGLGALWPLVLLAAAAGLLLATASSRGSLLAHGAKKEPRDGWRGGALGLAGLIGVAAALAWAVAPTSASGPEGMPRGFESGLRYFVPALVLGLALLPAAPPLRSRFLHLSASMSQLFPHTGERRDNKLGWRVVAAVGVALIAIGVGYPVQRHYLDHRYTDPTFTDAPGLNAAFARARDVEDSRIATTSTRQYPLFGTDLSNRVEFVGEPRPHGGFVPPTTCRRWRELLNHGNYDYVVTTRDRLEPNKPPYPPATAWTRSPAAKPILEQPPTVVFRLEEPLDPTSCPS